MAAGAILIDARDNVAVVTTPARAGEEATGAGGRTILCVSDVPQYHKVAVRAIAVGEPVIKYGERIGVALASIRPGEHVHEHNLGPEED